MFTCQTAPRTLARAISLALGVSVLPATAAEYNWVGGYGDWDTVSNWDPQSLPQQGDSVAIHSGSLVTYNPVSPLHLTSVTVDGPAELHVIGSALYADTLVAGATAQSFEGEIHLSDGYLGGTQLQIGRDAGSDGKFLWDGGDLDVERISIGTGGSGSFVYNTAGSWSLAPHQSVIIGEQAGSNGVLEQWSGTVDAWASQIIIGDAGNGIYRQIGGNHYAAETVIGRQAGGVGTYEMYGYSNHSSERTVVGDAGTGHYLQRGMYYHTTNELIVGRSAGGIGEYQLDGYGLNASSVVLGDEAGSEGTFTWTNGDLDARRIVVGRNGAGTFVMDSGQTLSFDDDFNPGKSLVIGEQAGSEGVFEQRSGYVQHNREPLIVGQGGRGVYRLVGGQLQAGEILLGRYAGSEGVFELNGDGASLHASATLIGQEGAGRFIHSGGLHASGNIEIGTDYATGHYAFSGGWLYAQSLHINNGEFSWTGGELDVADIRVGTNMSTSDRSGTFIQELGQYNTLALYPGRTIVVGGDGGHGVYEQRSGNIDATQGQVIIGGGGYGTYRHLDGTHMANETVIGQQPAGGWHYPQGRYELLGDAADHVAQRTVVADGGGATGQFIHAAGSNHTRELLVGRGGGRGEYLMSGGYLDTDSIVLGESGEGRFVWTGGDIYFNNLTVGGSGTGTFVQDIGAYNEWYVQPHQRLVIGEQAGSGGVFEQRSGNLNAWNSQIIVGEAGSGNYLQLDGSHDSNEVVIAHLSGSEGHYELAGDNAGLHTQQRTVVGDDGDGQFMHTAGSHHTQELVLGRGTSTHAATGIYEMSGMYSNLDTGRTVVGARGMGRFVQSDGWHYTQDLIVGQAEGSNGEYELRGGSLETQTTRIGATSDATGAMKLIGANASWWNHGNVYVGAEMFTPADIGVALLELQDGAMMRADAVIVGETGTVRGNGRIDADVTNKGRLAAGLSAGQLDIIGNYTQLAEGTLSIEIGGHYPGIDHDYLYVFGDANLAGSLDVSLLGDYQFSLGESFDILYANMVYGSFNSLLFPIFDGMTFDIVYDLDTVRLTVVNAVPVPAAAWLFGSGVVALMGVARRRKAA